MSALTVLQMMAALVVLAEALNKLERADLFDGRYGLRVVASGIASLAMPWRWKLPRVILVIKTIGWALLSIGSAAALMTPLIHLEKPNVEDVAVLVGFALLVVRSRLKEALSQ